MQTVLGFDFGGTKIAAAVCDLDGNRLADVVVPTSAADGARINLQYGIDSARTLLEKLGGHELMAIGACTFGIPGPDGVRLAPAIPGWEQMRLESELTQAFQSARVRVVTDVKAAAHAENESGALAGCDPGIYLNLGTGLAIAVVANGTVIAGRNGASGEIGYNLRSSVDVGRPESGRTVLEEAVSGMALARIASATSSKQLTAADVFAGARGDQMLADLVAEFVAELSFHLVNLTIAINPARIVVGGGLAGSWEQLCTGLRQALDAAVPYPPELMLARYPFDAPLRGALSLGLAAARDLAGASTAHPMDESEPPPVQLISPRSGPANPMRKEQSR